MSSPDREPSPLVVVGASAGGIEALSTLLGSLPASFPAPIVVAQHLDPDRESHLGEVLARRTPLAVRTVSASEPLTPGTVYLIPEGRDAEVADDQIAIAPGERRHPMPSVDRLLESAARDRGEDVIAVILTGSGSDGAAGAKAVKAAGGTVVIEDPATAQFPSMPQSIPPTAVDISAPIDRIGAVLTDLVSNVPEASVDEPPPELRSLLEQLRLRRGIDFSAYKTPTIVRRLHRRMAAVGAPTIKAYVDLLPANPEEEERLVSSFLIKVTEFFRDPALYDCLRETVLPDLIATARAEGRELRIWSAGCATGEEAYSLAMLVTDLLAGPGDPVPVRIFATDLDAGAVAFARRGVYPPAALRHLPKDQVARSFVQREGAFELTRRIRALVVFGQHDLSQRPPFPHTDLVLCRNVLIYFTPALQERVLRLFAYSLRDGGYLVLGKAESPAPLAEYFEEVDRRQRVYRRHGARVALPVVPPSPPTPLGIGERRSTPAVAALSGAAPVVAPTANVAEILRQLPVGVVVVGHRYDIQSINPAARDLLGIHGLALGEDLIHLAERVPSTALRGAIDAVRRGDAAVDLEPVSTTDEATGKPRHLAVSCHPGTAGGGADAPVIVVVRDISGEVEERAEQERRAETLDRLVEANRALLEANRELTENVDLLRQENDGLQMANASLQVSGEEVVTLNEELQSTNEELETLNEETQATLEELNTANADLEARSSELRDLATRHAEERALLSAVLQSMGEAVLVVDRDGTVLRTNEAYDNLVATAQGPFQERSRDGALLDDAVPLERRAAGGEAFEASYTIVAADGALHWFDAIGRPLRSAAGGGVVVLRDVSERNLNRLQSRFIALASHELRTPLTALYGFLQLARAMQQSGRSDEVADSLETAEDLARRLARMVDDLLDTARLESGRLTLKLAPTEVNAVVRREVSIAQRLTEAQRIVLSEAPTPLVVNADADRIGQVVLNLLSNAIRYAPGTPLVEVAVRRVGDEAEISVHDSGPGMSEPDIERVFSRFAQVEAERGPALRGLGLGLGLYIAHEIVSLHGGTIGATSSPGGGTTFTVRLPLAGTAADSA